MKRSGGSLAAVLFGGCVALAAAGAFGQSDSNQAGQRRRTPLSSGGSGPSNNQAPMPSQQRTPLPDAQRVPMPEVGGRTPIGGAPGGSLPDVPSARDRIRNAPPEAVDEPGSEPDVAPDAPYSGVDPNEAARRRGYGRGGYRRPTYYDYDPWRYDNYRRYDDGYRGFGEPYRYNPPPPRDYGYGGEPPAVAEPPANPAAAADAALLPPEGLMDEDLPPALRKAVDGSPQYREAMAQILRVWPEYARAAEQVLQRLRSNPAYQRALAQQRDAEAKVANLRDRGGNVPAVNLVGAAQQALLARRAVRALEERAIDADPVASRAKQQLDQAIDRRNKVRDEIAAKLPVGPLAEPAR